MFADLPARGAVNPRVGHSSLPVQEQQVLLLERAETSAFQSVVLDVVDALFDLALVAGRVGARWPEHDPIVLAEGANFGVELGIEPIARLYRAAEVIEYQPPCRSTKVPEGALDAAEEVVCGLALDSLAIGLAAM